MTSDRVPPPVGTPQWHPDWWPEWARNRYESDRAEWERQQALHGAGAVALGGHHRDSEPQSERYEEHQMASGYETVRNLLRVLAADPGAREALRGALDEGVSG